MSIFNKAGGVMAVAVGMRVRPDSVRTAPPCGGAFIPHLNFQLLA